MTTLRETWARLVSFFRTRALDRELDEELAAHVDLATEDYIRQGMSASDARRVALARLGGVEAAKQRHRESRGLPSLDGLVQDARYAVRALRRSPGVVLTTIVTLAVGIGINTAAFTVTNAVLFKGFALVQDNDRLLYIASRGLGYGPFVSYPDFHDWRAQARSFEGMGAVNAVRVSLADLRGFPVMCNATQVSAITFALLGQLPVLGRDFAAPDEAPGAAPVAILSHGFWQRRYGGDPAVVGQTVRINGTPTTVIGVMAQGFSFPRAQDLWVPLVPTADLQKRDARGLWFVFGRMAKGVTIETVRSEMDTIGSNLANTYPRTNHGLRPVVQSFHEFFVGSSATTMFGAMLGALGAVLLIACSNLANLQLGRAVGRSREMSIHVALGAGRWRIVRQSLMESVMLSAVGGILGGLMATWCVRAYELTAGPPGWFDRLPDHAADYRVFAYLVAISLAAGLLFGLVPVSRLSTLDVNATLKERGRGAGERGGTRLSSLLVIGEMALAVVLVTGAGVMIRSFLNIYTADLGVKPENILTAFLELPEARYPHAGAQMAFYDRLEARLAAIPGVESVAMADRFPTQSARRLQYELAGAGAVDEQRRPSVSALAIGPGYFQTLGAAVLAGREFDSSDDVSGAPVVIVNQQLASRFWPGEDPLGKRIRLVDDTTPTAWRTVVGVVPNIVQNDVTRQSFDPLVYVPYRQPPTAGMWIFARTRVPPGSLAAVVRREVQALDADLPLFDSMPLANRLTDGSRHNERVAGMFLIVGAMALLLAASGLYAVVARAVSQRTREIGIRMALGATTAEILGLVFRQGMRPVAIGLVIGLAAALAIMPLLESALVSVSPADPLTLGAASSALLAAALLGCLIPARRAMRVDPVVALRHE